jgi:hypothetical protein
MMSAPASPANKLAPPTPRLRRPRPGRDDGETFGQFTPWRNRAAVYAYAVALAGLTPALGAALGPVAVLLGVVGLIRVKRRPEVEGVNFAVAGIVLGVIDTLFNVAGLWCIGRGLGG